MITKSSQALELGKHNITVNAYAPGVIQTQIRTFHVNIACSLKLITFANLVDSISDQSGNVSLADEDSTNYLTQVCLCSLRARVYLYRRLTSCS